MEFMDLHNVVNHGLLSRRMTYSNVDFFDLPNAFHYALAYFCRS